MAEWTIALVLKTRGCHSPVSSNLTSSARFIMKHILVIISLLFLIGCTNIPVMNGSKMYLTKDAFDKVRSMDKVDDEYKALFLQELLLERGIKSKLVIGQIKSGFHAWSEVEIDNDIYILDVAKNKFEKRIDIIQEYLDTYFICENYVH